MFNILLFLYIVHLKKKKKKKKEEEEEEKNKKKINLGCAYYTIKMDFP
jgi:hypothetical protein